MSAGKHTPGPWEAKHSRISWWVEAPTDKSRFASGPIQADFWHQEPGQRANCEALANARLIAAAPDLLEALDKCRAIIKFHVKDAGASCSFSPDEAPFSALDAYKLAVSAIAKAVGND